jgi:hypothetical protein
MNAKKVASLVLLAVVIAALIWLFSARQSGAGKAADAGQPTPPVPVKPFEQVSSARLTQTAAQLAVPPLLNFPMITLREIS